MQQHSRFFTSKQARCEKRVYFLTKHIGKNALNEEINVNAPSTEPP